MIYIYDVDSYVEVEIEINIVKSTAIKSHWSTIFTVQSKTNCDANQ
jgi:hypothetical protein